MGYDRSDCAVGRGFWASRPKEMLESVWSFDERNPLPLIRVDTDGVVMAVNAAAVAAFGSGLAPGRALRETLAVFKDVRWDACLHGGEPLQFCADSGGVCFQFWGIADPAGAFIQLYAKDVDRKARHEGRRAVTDLQRRMRELSCYHGLAESVRTRLNVSEICQDLAALIPLAWRYPELARARIIVDGRTFVSQTFEETVWGQSSAVVANDEARGMIQVFYTEDPRRQPGDDIFLAAERHLLDTLSRTLGETIQRREAELESRQKTVVLAQERNRFETILRGIGEGVVVTDASDRVLLMNRAALELLGIEDREPLGEPFLSLIEDAMFTEMWRKTAARGVDFSKQELTAPGGPGRTLWATRSRIPDLHHGEAGHVSILQDVTREREINRMKTDFVSSVSHELRTPMTSIKGFAKTLMTRPDLDGEHRQRFIAIMNSEADRMIALIEELLVIARIESGLIVPERTPVDLEELLKRAAQALETEALKKDILLRVVVNGGLKRPIGDPEKIYIVLFNLAENAVKFTPAGGCVTLRAFGAEGAAVAQVEDSGLGIPECERGKIFDRFYRIHRPGAQDRGTGLGLYIVGEMLRLHGGQIELASEEGKGSTFTVRLPLGRGEAAQAAPAAGLKENADG